MAKKSAKSKGYRRQSVKKPYLSKKEILILCLVVLVVGIGAILLFRYDDGALKVQDGAVVTEGDNWLIVNGSNVRGRARYFKLGEIGEIDGTSREKRAMVTDINLPEYVFTPQDTADGVTDIRVACGHSSAAGMAQYTMNTMTALEGEMEIGELQTAEIAGHNVQYYYYTNHARPAEETAEAQPVEGADEAAAEAQVAEDTDEAADEAQPAEDADGQAAGSYTRSIAAYIDAAHASCIVLNAEGSAETAEACPTDEALMDALTRAVSAVTLEQK